LKGEETKRCSGEGEGELGCEVGEDVVVYFVRGWLGSFGVQEEGAEIAAKI
jgi:hypothetical protein